MTTTATTMTATTMTDWIRPWYPGHGAGDHIDKNCSALAEQTSTPVEGSGWLDPNTGNTCETCLPPWDATCETCHASMSVDEYSADPRSETNAKQWKSDHQCHPQVRLIPPPRENPPAAKAGQMPLLTLEDAAA